MSATLYAGVMISVCKRVEFVIRSVNNLKTARYNIVNVYKNKDNSMYGEGRQE